MKFLIKDNPISYNEIYSAVKSYASDNHGKWPSYLLIHPETRRNIIISSQDENKGFHFNVVQMAFDSKKHEYIRTKETMMGLYLIRTEDVEPGFIVLCG